MKKDKNNNLLITLSEVTELDIIDDKQVYELAGTITTSINLSALRKSIDNACMQLSQVGSPSFGADVKYIALDNQARLDLAYKLLYTYNLIETDVKNFRKNKLRCRENSEYLLNFIYNTIDTLKTAKEYQEFRLQEKQENMKYLEETKKKLLGNGDVIKVE